MVTSLRAIFIVIPILELILFIVMVNQIGLLDALALQLVSMVLGLLAIRVLGTASLSEVQAALAQERPPGPAMVRGACVMIGGTLMIVPGYLTDLVGLALLVPGLRDFFGRMIWRMVRRPGTAGGSGGVIDGEWHEVPADRLDRRPDPPAPRDPDSDR